MRGRTPVLYCDAEDGFCGTWDLDYYAGTVSAVNDVPITSTERAPGWTVTPDDEDLCPEHSLPPETLTPTERPGSQS